MNQFVPSYLRIHAVCDNNIDAIILQVWAREALMQLFERMTIGSIINRDYSDDIAEEGDTVNIRRINEMTASRKDDRSSVVAQDVVYGNVPVVLNQHWYSSFLVKDGEMSKGYANIVEDHIGPAARAIARNIDRMLLGQVTQFLGNNAGQIGGLTSSNVVDYVTDSRLVMDDNLVPDDPGDRMMFITPNAEATMLKNEIFHSAEKVGDFGAALRSAQIGRKFNIDFFKAHNVPNPAAGVTTAGATDANEAAGEETISVAIGGDETIGHWLLIAGDDIPHRVFAAVAGDTLDIYPVTKRATTSGAVVTHYTQGAVNQASTALDDGGDGTTAGYREGWHGPIAYDGLAASSIKRGQIVTFGSPTSAAAMAAQPIYTVIDVTTTTFTLDRPLEAAVANDAVINPGPGGSYNFGLHRNAITLVNRPLALPGSNLANSVVVNYNGIAIRITVTYDGWKQGHLVTLDTLCGVKVLDERLGMVMYS